MQHNLREHLANERTFLAWLNTSIAIIAFGFVLERFSLFLKYLAPAAGEAIAHAGTGLVGMAMIWLGTLLIPVSLWRFLMEQRNIHQPTGTKSANWPIVTLTILLTAVGVYLALTIAP